MKRTCGTYEKLGNIEFYIPNPLPPQNPPLELSPQLSELYGQTMLNIGKINEISNRVPDLQRFIKSYVIKEALLSSEIENIHTTVLDIFTQSMQGDAQSKNDTQLVLHYIQATEYAVSMIKTKHMPITNRLLMQTHEILLGTTQSDAGNYRTHTVRVGNFIPPQAHHIPRLMSDLEHFINNDDTIPSLIKAGLAHVQFETIHPFSDGNGRIGRLLIILMLIDSKIINSPIIYPSYYFKKHRFEYYNRLDSIRTQGDFEGWIYYYLTALNQSCIDAYHRAQALEQLETTLKETIAMSDLFSKSSKSIQQAQKALTIFFQSPVISIQEVSTRLTISYNTAQSLIKKFIEIDILHEFTEQKRNRRFYFKRYIDVLEKDF